MNPNALPGLLLPLVIVGIFLFIVILPARKQRQKIEAFLAALKAGDKVITSGGIYGTITKVDEKVLQLQIADKVRIDVSRTAIVGYQGQSPVTETQ